LSADGNSIVSGSADNLVKIWDVKTGAEVSIFVGTRCGRRGAGGVERRGSPQVPPWNWSERKVDGRQVHTLTGRSE
jgi:WD40 repeat protein